MAELKLCYIYMRQQTNGDCLLECFMGLKITHTLLKRNRVIPVLWWGPHGRVRSMDVNVLPLDIKKKHKCVNERNRNIYKYMGIFFPLEVRCIQLQYSPRVTSHRASIREYIFHSQRLATREWLVYNELDRNNSTRKYSQFGTREYSRVNVLNSIYSRK